MLKEILIGALVLGLGMTGTAFANKLDPKWSLARKEANALGDAAKAGQAGAYQTLVNKAAFRDAPAAHNIGWLYQKGFPGKLADREKACGWFGKAAKRAYPPSMHEHALCLFGLAKNAKDKKARTKLEKQAYQALFDAAKAGWVKSAIYFSEKILNLPLPSNKDFIIAGMVIDYGLGSNPAHEEKVTLSYFKGMRVVYGSGSGSYYYKKGRDGLRFAEKNGNPHAGKALPALYTKWVRSLIKSMDAWSPPEQSGLDCYRKKPANSTDKGAIAIECGSLNLRKEKKLERLTKDSETLQYEVSGQEKAGLILAKDRLNDRSAQFRADSKKLADIFIRSLPK